MVERNPALGVERDEVGVAGVPPDRPDRDREDHEDRHREEQQAADAAPGAPTPPAPGGARPVPGGIAWQRGGAAVHPRRGCGGSGVAAGGLGHDGDRRGRDHFARRRIGGAPWGLRTAGSLGTARGDTDGRGDRTRERIDAVGAGIEHEHGDVVVTPGLVGRVHERVGGRGRVGLAPQDLSDAVRADHGREPVRTQHHAVVRLQHERVDVDVDRRVDPERARDDRTLRMHRRLFLGEPAVADQFFDEAVVHRDPLQRVVPEEVGA